MLEYVVFDQDLLDDVEDKLRLQTQDLILLFDLGVCVEQVLELPGEVRRIEDLAALYLGVKVLEAWGSDGNGFAHEVSVKEFLLEKELLGFFWNRVVGVEYFGTEVVLQLVQECSG